MAERRDDGPVRRPPVVSQNFGLRMPVSEKDVVLTGSGELFEDPLADVDGNELHAGVGTVCARCDAVIRSGEPVQRMVSGAYEHQSCPKG